MEKIDLPEEWKGWYFNKDWIYDPDGNGYRQTDVITTFFTRDFMKNVQGDEAGIITMKSHLERRIDMIRGELVVTWNGEELARTVPFPVFHQSTHCPPREQKPLRSIAFMDLFRKRK